MIIGICGKSGCGKSTLANEFIYEFGDNCIHVDIDKIGHYVYKYNEVLDEMIKHFGSEVIVNGIVDRKVLGNIVFNSKEKMDKLTDITWKFMEREIDNIILDNKDKIIILDWALLPKTKFFDMCDKKVLLDIPYEIRKGRAMMRDNISSDKFGLRERNSLNYDDNLFDYVIKNNDKCEVKRMVRKI